MLPLLNATSGLQTALSSEIISSDAYNIFLSHIFTGVTIGIGIGLLVRFTWWIWK